MKSCDQGNGVLSFTMSRFLTPLPGSLSRASDSDTSELTMSRTIEVRTAAPGQNFSYQLLAHLGDDSKLRLCVACERQDDLLIDADPGSLCR